MTATLAAGITCAKCKAKHPTVADVRACQLGAPRVEQVNPALGAPAPAAGSAAVKPASEKQVAFLTKLVTERTPESDDDTRRMYVELVVAKGSREVSKEIDRLLALPKPAAPPKASSVDAPPARPHLPLEMGMYKSAEHGFIRVYPARSGGHLLAKKLIEDADAASGFAFQYLGLASRFVTPADKLSFEEAAAFGVQFGVCCVCAATLTDPESVSLGIGPICRSKF